MPDVALVTGANRGIGLEVTRQLARRDITVILGSRSLEKGERAAAELLISAQLSKPGSPVALYNRE